MTSEKKLVKSTAIVSLGIMTSRVLGFVRDMLMANFFGTKMFAQAFVMAFTVPNALRMLVGEGAVDTVLVPVFTEYRAKKDKYEFLHFTNVLFNLSFVVLSLITIIGILAAPILIVIIAPGFIIDHEKFSLTVKLTKILFPYILLVGLTAYCTGVLNTFRRFAAPAFGSAVWNATVISAMLIFYSSFNVTHLVFAILIGGLLQLLLQIIPLLKIGPFFNIKAGLWHKGAKKVGKLLFPRMIGASIYEINVIIDRLLASLQFIVGEGAVAALYYGNRLFQLPLALFGIAISTVALPTMSSFFVEKDTEKFKNSISFSMRNMLFLSMPASIGLMVLSRPIIKVIFERGEFTSHATDVTSCVLFFYAIGIAAYGGVKILVSAFYAMQDTVTPVKIAFLAMLTNIVINLILIVPLKAGGLALATSIAGFVNLTALFVILKNKIGEFGEKEIFHSFLKILSASLIMGSLAYILMMTMPWDGGLKDAVYLILIISFSIVAYLGVSVALKVKEIMMVFSWIKRY